MAYANPQFLISAAQLKSELSAASAHLRVFDCTVHLRPDPPRYKVESGAATFAEGHIPGATFLDLTGALSDSTSKFGFTLPPPAQLQSALREAGIDDNSRIVLYSRGHMMWATRAWWMLHSAGHGNVAVLDGGYQAWQAAGGEQAGDSQGSGAAKTTRKAGNFVVRMNARRWADKNEVRDAVGSGAACTINALSSEVYAGTAPVNYGRAGHIPRSINIPYDSILANGCFKDADALQSTFAARGVLDGRRIIAYCGGGISATIDALALRLIGRDDVAVYDGSMSEWAADPDLPLTVGHEP